MSTFTTATGAGAFTPDDYAPVVVAAVQDASVAFQVASRFDTGSTKVHVPVVAEDAAAAWTAEGDEITEDDPTLAEIVVTPSKVAGIVRVSNEMASDSSPDAVNVVGQGLARSIAQKVDAAFVGNLAAPAPKGLGSLSGIGTVDAGTGFTNLDPFLEAQSNAEVAGGQVTSFLISPADMLTLGQLKKGTDSNEPLLSIDPTMPTRRMINGVPLYVCRSLAAGTVYGVDQTRTIVVLRSDTQVVTSADAYFGTDEVGVRATMRIGFAFPSPSVAQKITYTAA